MSPPELAADAPVLYVFKPQAVSGLVFFWHEADYVVHYRAERYFGKVLHFDEPLQRQAWLDRHFGALRETDVVYIVLYLFH